MNLKCRHYKTPGCGVDNCSGEIAHEGESFFYLVKDGEKLTDIGENFGSCDVTSGLSQGCQQSRLTERIVKVLESGE